MHSATSTTMPPASLDDEQLDELLAYWNAANYLTVAQIYLLANPLLREPLRAEHIKPRLLGHWGTSPGLNLVYAQLNRLIRRTGQQVLYVAGPGHGGPAVVANVYLEGTYSEIYPRVSEDETGLLELVRQFSTPGGIPSHVGVPTPGSIHEGGELGYALVHAFGAAFDNPDLLVACVIGDGEAETAPLEGSWKGIRFLDPARDGAVLPILHLNDHKISGPTVLGRVPEEDLLAMLRGHGYAPRIVAGDDPRQVHREFAAERPLVDTTMGFTPLEGVPMATRSGSIDPGMLLHLLAAGIELDELDEALNHRSGLRGITGLTGLREVELAAIGGDERAQLAADVLVRGISGAVAAMTTSLRGLDALVFTAGAGERSALLRGDVCARLEQLDEAANAQHAEQIGAEQAPVAVLVVRAGEEIVVARETADVLSAR